jgi:hypothetical protein
VICIRVSSACCGALQPGRIGLPLFHAGKKVQRTAPTEKACAKVPLCKK